MLSVILCWLTSVLFILLCKPGKREREQELSLRHRKQMSVLEKLRRQKSARSSGM